MKEQANGAMHAAAQQKGTWWWTGAMFWRGAGTFWWRGGCIQFDRHSWHGVCVTSSGRQVDESMQQLSREVPGGGLGLCLGGGGLGYLGGGEAAHIVVITPGS